MKPISLEISAFGPYGGREYIDFNRLADGGLFLICGETGSGKTMLLDAISFALFGKSTGDNRNDLTALRSNRCAFEATTLVSFVFEQDGKVYKFERRLERKRKNLSASAAALRMDDEGIFVPLYENAKEKEVNKKAEELIGFSYEQFRQIIVLPQGQFEKFLVADPDEKEQILSNIFGASYWENVAENFYQIAEKNRKDLEETKQAIAMRLEQTGCEDRDSLSEYIDKLREKLSILEAEHDKKDHKAELQEIERQKKTVLDYKELDSRVKKLNELELKKEEIRAKEKLKASAEAAEGFRNQVKELEEAKNAVTARELSIKIIGADIEKSEKLQKKSEEALSRHQDKSDEYEQKKTLKTKLESKREKYAAIDKLEKELKEKTDIYSKLAKKETEAKSAYDAEAAKAIHAKQEYDQAKERHAVLLDKYHAGIYGDIAARLTDGAACPVCGSCEHPHLAERSEDAVSKEDTDRAKEAEDKAYHTMGELDKAAKIKQQLYEDVKNKRSDAEAKRNIAEERLETVKEELIVNIANGTELEHKIEKLEAEISEYNEKEGELKKVLEDAKIKLGKEKSRQETLTAEYRTELDKADKLEQKLQADMAASEFKNIEDIKKNLLEKTRISQLNKEIADFYANINSANKLIIEKQSEIGNAARPDEAALKDREEKLRSENDSYIKEHTSIANSIDNLSKALNKIDELSGNFTERLVQADDDLSFAKRLRGDTGVGLHRYVLGIMFGSVIAAANKMLENVHGGRYRLCRTDDKLAGKNKRGLGLKVYDSFSETGEARDVSTLSGGEKFLVSLALSIGVSSAASGSGAKIEAMFIDEGFGTLDDSSVHDALEIIGSIRRSNGLVGIISHVQVLRDNIPNKLVVNKSREGSTVSIVTG